MTRVDLFDRLKQLVGNRILGFSDTDEPFTINLDGKFSLEDLDWMCLMIRDHQNATNSDSK